MPATPEKTPLQMTDLEKFIALYRGFGITLEVKLPTMREKTRWYMLDDEEWVVVKAIIEMGDAHEFQKGVVKTEKFEGYGGFFSDVLFDEAGKFLYQGFWE